MRCLDWIKKDNAAADSVRLIDFTSRDEQALVGMAIGRGMKVLTHSYDAETGMVSMLVELDEPKVKSAPSFVAKLE